VTFRIAIAAFFPVWRVFQKYFSLSFLRIFLPSTGVIAVHKMAVLEKHGKASFDIVLRKKPPLLKSFSQMIVLALSSVTETLHTMRLTNSDRFSYRNMLPNIGSTFATKKCIFSLSKISNSVERPQVLSEKYGCLTHVPNEKGI
jgi:hypothetical protein